MAASNEVAIPTFCGFCHANCGIIAYVTNGKLSKAQLYSYAKFARQPKYVVEMLVAEGKPWREAARLSATSVDEQESDLDI